MSQPTGVPLQGPKRAWPRRPSASAPCRGAACPTWRAQAGQITWINCLARIGELNLPRFIQHHAVDPQHGWFSIWLPCKTTSKVRHSTKYTYVIFSCMGEASKCQPQRTTGMSSHWRKPHQMEIVPNYGFRQKRVSRFSS